MAVETTPQEISEHDEAVHRLKQSIDIYAQLSDELKKLADAIARQCEEHGIRAMNTDRASITYTEETIWDDQLLQRLDVPEEQKEQYLNKPVERKWDKRKLLSLAKYGGPNATLIKLAQSKSRPVLKFKFSKKDDSDTGTTTE